MCTDTTKQEISFLIALSGRAGLSRLEVARDLPRLLRSLDWPEFLVDEPKNVDTLFAEASRKGTSERSAPFAWRCNQQGHERLFDLIQRFAPETERKKLLEAADVFA